MAATKIGHGMAKALGIKLHYRNELPREQIARGESVYSTATADTYVEQEPTSMDWILEQLPTGHEASQYLLSLFPFVNWIHRYNVQWLIGDLIAGITVGAVVVPQSMAYAQLANLQVEFGLYSAFMGVLIYWFFATSKDITIGPVAVMSTIVGNIINRVGPNLRKTEHLENYQIASALAIIVGAIVAFLGLARLGFLVEFISLPAVCAFITGSAFSIAMGQVAPMLGIPSSIVNTRRETYHVVIDTLKHLGSTKLDAALGLTALLMLYLIRTICQTAAKRWSNHQKIIFFISTLRTAFVILLYTLISWACNSHIPRTTKGVKNAKWAMLGPVPRGFQDAGVPRINTNIISAFAGEIPVSVIVLLIEHISIAKSFGRINNYQINPSQELLAIGVTNLLGPFLGAYPATGSFSRTAIKSKAGVRTPLAGVITAIVVLLAIYALPTVFFYIPKAVLSAVIIHAVLDLLTPANTVYQFWRISPLEVLIFFAGVFVTVFSSIENGIYTTVVVSAALLLFRLVKAQGRFLGTVKVHSVIGDHLMEDEDKDAGKGRLALKNTAPTDLSVRNVFLPINHHDGSNPALEVDAPYPGVFIYRFSEGYNYPNASHYLDYMVQTIFMETRRTDPKAYPRPGDRPWNDPGPRKGQEEPGMDKPTLKAIIVDFSSVNNVDVTSVQHMIDVRNQLDRYAAPHTVEWHFACINNRWTKRALASAGFGFPTPESETGEFRRWKPIFSVAEMGGKDSAAAAAEQSYNKTHRNLSQQHHAHDIESRRSVSTPPINSLEKELTQSKAYAGDTKVAVVQGLNRPYFHIDLTSALQSAIAGAEQLEDSHTTPTPAKGYGTTDTREASSSGTDSPR